MIDQRNPPSVSGQLHVVKLRERRINVQLQYSSPPRKHPKNMVRQVDLQLNHHEKTQDIKIRKVKYLNSQRSMRRYPITKRSPYFYVNRIEEGENLIAEYQKFQKRMENNELEPGKIKVYSNSKALREAKEAKEMKEMKTKDLINKDTNIKQNNAKNKANVPIRKIRLYSPKKALSHQKENLQNSLATIKLHTANQANASHKASPCRKYKLEVTSSKSKNKYDSILSNKQQHSLQVSKQAKQKQLEQTPSKHLKSFNSYSLNQR